MVLTGHAAADADDLLRMAALGMRQSTHIAKDPVLGVLTHSACVHQHKVSTFRRIREGIAHPGKVAPEPLRVGLILLAAVGVHIGQFPAWPLIKQVPDPVAEVQLPGYVFGGNGGRLSQGLLLRLVVIIQSGV